MNFTRAAEELHVSQPALHVKVQKLAAALGQVLYRKQGRGLVLTDAGRSLADFGRQVRSQVEHFVAGLGAVDEPYVIAAGQGATRYVISGAVRLLVSRGVRLRLLNADRQATVEAVRTGKALVGVTVIGRAPAGLTCIPLATYHQVAVMPAGHSLARRRGLALADLVSYEIVVPPPGPPQRAGLERAAKAQGQRLRVSAEAQGWPQVLHLVSLGVGIGLVNGCVEVPEGMVARAVEDLPDVTYSLLYRNSDAGTAAVRRIVETVQASLR